LDMIDSPLLIVFNMPLLLLRLNEEHNPQGLTP